MTGTDSQTAGHSLEKRGRTMNPAVVIPTYWSKGERLGEPGGPYC